jgi:hypothetical protein
MTSLIPSLYLLAYTIIHSILAAQIVKNRLYQIISPRLVPRLWQK